MEYLMNSKTSKYFQSPINFNTTCREL